MIKNLLDGIENLSFSIENSREETARKKLPPRAEKKYREHVFNFSSNISKLHDGMSSVNTAFPGPYYIAWYEKFSDQGFHLCYEFSYIKSKLEHKKRNFLRSKIFAHVGETDLISGVPYLGDTLKKS